MFAKPYADLVARLRIPIGFLVAAAFAAFSAPTVSSLRTGILVSACGLALRGWAAGHLAKNQRLAVSGPFAYTRNPLYLGTLLAAAGLLIASRSWWLAILFAAVFILVYLPVIELEEQHLRKLFPEYADYAKRVPALVPGLSKARPKTSAFQFSLYWKNQEYQALAGFLAGALFLAWKVYS
jgi:protein-S-isoprenylcysteine O-methyltransferase Ste14